MSREATSQHNRPWREEGAGQGGRPPNNSGRRLSSSQRSESPSSTIGDTRTSATVRRTTISTPAELEGTIRNISQIGKDRRDAHDHVQSRNSYQSRSISPSAGSPTSTSMTSSSSYAQYLARQQLQRGKSDSSSDINRQSHDNIQLLGPDESLSVAVQAMRNIQVESSLVGQQQHPRLRPVDNVSVPVASDRTMPLPETTNREQEHHPRSTARPPSINVSVEMASSRQAAMSETSRELRTRRLRESHQRQQDRHGESVAPSGSKDALHFQAHSPAVEKYLTRNQRKDNSISGTPPLPSTKAQSTREREAPAESHNHKPHIPHVSELFRTTTNADPHPMQSTTTVPMKPFRDDERASQTYKLDQNPRTWNLSGWSTLKKSAQSVVQPPSSYDQYLARTQQKAANPPQSELPRSRELSRSRSSSFDGESDSSATQEAAPPISSSDSSEEDEDVGPEWSVRVCVVSAVDLPASVIPNLPLSPMLKVAVVPFPIAEIDNNSDNPQVNQTKVNTNKQAELHRRLQQRIEQSGLESIRKGRIRGTSSKILSKRDNGSVEFHEELRWDNVRRPHETALALELVSRAVMTPANIRESPRPQTVEPLQLMAPPMSSFPSSSTGPSSPPKVSEETRSGIGSLFRRQGASTSRGMETAQAAAAVAKLLVEGDSSVEQGSTVSEDVVAYPRPSNQCELNVKLRPSKKRINRRTEDLILGSLVIPLWKMPLDKAMQSGETCRIEQWFELSSSVNLPSPNQKSSNSSPPSAKRNPSLLLEISFSRPEMLDDSEDDMDEHDDSYISYKASFAKRASLQIKKQLKQDVAPTKKEATKVEEPELRPGIIDFICVVGAHNIGDQKADDGTVGWVNATHEVGILEQFPPDDEFHTKYGRTATLPNKIEWFCFPEGLRLWRGSTPPNSEELNLKRFSASSPSNISACASLFDAYLGCTSSFSWFVIASSADSYGSESVKTYGAVIRFFVPAPIGVDPTQDDFGQTATNDYGLISDRKRLWVPLAICLTSSLPIVGVMEAMLLRTCEELSWSGISFGGNMLSYVQKQIIDLIMNYQKPLAGVVNCSLSFLNGDRLFVALPTTTGFPALPHGNSVASTCRLLGADGINLLLSALLTESKILLHSDDIANLCLVAEVLTALLYPFQWTLPYIPVLPAEMMEFLEAPLPFLVGIPSCNLNLIDPATFEDFVLVDLDSASDAFHHRRIGFKTKLPTPLPATVASNISKAVYRLLKAEEAMEQSYASSKIPGTLSFPRMEPESVAERDLRLAVALEVCGLVRGLEKCLVYASSAQPVFNMDKFLQTAPAVFEEQRGTAAVQGSGQSPIQRVISPRSRRFMSLFVNCQHFHQFIDLLASEQVSFFREINSLLRSKESDANDSSFGTKLQSFDIDKTLDELSKALQRLEDKIPTYRIQSNGDRERGKDQEQLRRDSVQRGFLFPFDLLKPTKSTWLPDEADIEHAGAVKHISLEYLVELEKRPWRYQKILDGAATLAETSGMIASQSVKIRDAIGDRRYRAWKMRQGQFDGDEVSLLSDDSKSVGGSIALDLKSLVKVADADPTLVEQHSSDNQQRIADARDRDLLRRCLERINSTGEPTSDGFSDRGKDWIAEAELALRNKSARNFLLSVLGKRHRPSGPSAAGNVTPTRPTAQTASKLDQTAFDALVRLACAMLDACMNAKDYSSPYSLLKSTAGLYTAVGDGDELSLVYMTGRIGLHPIFADLGVWELVKDYHLLARQEVNEDESQSFALYEARNEETDVSAETEEYEAVVATLYEMVGYGIPAEELARFASRVSEINEWFGTERGQTLLLLARRLSVRRDLGENSGSVARNTDFEIMSPSGKSKELVSATRDRAKSATGVALSDDVIWSEIGWCHPVAQSTRRLNPTDSSNARRSITQNLLNMNDEQRVLSSGKLGGNYMKRAAITSMAYLGSSVVITGGLDGGVFMAHRVKVDPSNARDESASDLIGIRGLHLDWGSSGSRYTSGAASTSLDGEYGVGAVSCLVATRGSQHSSQAIGLSPRSAGNDVVEALSNDDILRGMDGYRVVAGTTCGDLRVWSIKDVFSAIFYSQGSDLGHCDSSMRRGSTDYSAGSSLTRLKFSLRGRALSGHRGGVSCVDVPSHVYRPDSIVSGGADGLIKLWNLRTSALLGSTRSETERPSSRAIGSTGQDSSGVRSKVAKTGDALSILSGHGGRILCVKTAWHGDRLLSGGADRTVRVWDLAGSGGKCLSSLTGHFGWVTAVHYWGPNTVISASTDRSIALWDARARCSPLFSLRHHYAPISDLLVGSRADPVMVSAASDGTVAAWDFRQLSGSASPSKSAPLMSVNNNSMSHRCVRDPSARLYIEEFSDRRHLFGPVLLSRGTKSDRNTVLCMGNDSVMREWDIQTGRLLWAHVTGHCDNVSNFSSFHNDQIMDSPLEDTRSSAATGTITASWDGTVRMRSVVKSAW